MAHSAYPELGESQSTNWWRRCIGCGDGIAGQSEVGPSTMNIGVIEGGRAPM